jgi:maleylpyruvate isomerase
VAFNAGNDEYRNGMKLYGYWRSSSAWRVRIALELKGIIFENVPVHLARRGGEQHVRQFAELNPLSQVPVLEVEENGTRFSLTQSMAIIEYLEEKFGEPLLLPGDPLLRARAREFAEIINSGVQPFHNTGFHAELKRYLPNLPPAAFSKRFIERGLRALELLALPVARGFVLGETPTLADVYLVPQLYQARRFEVDVAPYPTLLRVERTCQALEAFQRAHPDRQPDAEPAAAIDPVPQ